MSPREPAERQLERVLHVLPIAACPDGASLAALAGELGVPEARLLRDIGEVTARADYLEPPVDIDILVEKDRITVWTTGEFRRPVKLAPREALHELGVRLETGVFGARMEVDLVNDGPVTIILGI